MSQIFLPALKHVRCVFAPLASLHRVSHPRSEVLSRTEDRHNVDTLSSPLRSRGNNPSVLWRTGGSPTFIVVYPSTVVNAVSVINVIDACYKLILHSIQQHGDVILPGGYFNWMGINGIAVEAINANNHQLTWGVLAAALKAVKQYMEANGYRQAHFDIYDGENMVGKGLIYTPPYLQPIIGD